MIPETVAALYAFLGLVTPGLVYQLLRERSRPALNETAFREASRVALTSALLTTASLLTLVGFSNLNGSWFVNARTWLRDGTAYVVAHTALVARNVIYVVALACAYAFLTHLAANGIRAVRKTRVVRGDVWWQLLVSEVPKEMAPWVQAKLDDGTTVWGHVDFFTVGRSIEDTELSLKGPKLRVRDAGSGEKKLQTYWERVVVRSSHIAMMKVRYIPKTGEPRPADATTTDEAQRDGVTDPLPGGTTVVTESNAQLGTSALPSPAPLPRPDAEANEPPPGPISAT